MKNTTAPNLDANIPAWMRRPAPQQPMHARQRASNMDSMYLRLFETAPQPCLLLTPDFKIIGANQSYLHMTSTERDVIASRDLFDVFPDNPLNPQADGTRSLEDSFLHVLREKRSDTIPRLR